MIVNAPISALLTVAEAAARLRQTPQTVRRKIREGDIGAVRLGEHGPLRVSIDELESHMSPVADRGRATRGEL